MTILDTLTVVVVDEPGRERDALRAILASMQNVRVVDLVNSCDLLEDWIVNRSPDVVIIRAHKVDEACVYHYRLAKNTHPRVRFLIIAETSDDIQIMTAAGFDRVFLKGFSSTELFNLLDHWSMEKIIHYFTDEQSQTTLMRRSSLLEVMN